MRISLILVALWSVPIIIFTLLWFKKGQVFDGGSLLDVVWFAITVVWTLIVSGISLGLALGRYL
jgi:hypothetical protein